MPTKGSIYTLTDPRDGAIRYVGKTTKPLSERLAGHLASPTNPAMRLWISTLAAQRLIPLITLVSTAPEERLSSEEERQISRHARQGHRLFNAPYYHQHLQDLTAPPTVPKHLPAPRPAGRPDPLLVFCQDRYGPFARVRVKGRRATAVVAGVVAILALGVVAYMLWRLWLVRFAAAVVLCSLYLSAIGFDRLVSEQVLPRLPVVQVAAFWHAYLAGPLLLIVLHALAAMYLQALSMYGNVRRNLPKVAASARLPRELDAVDIAAAAAADLDAAVVKDRTA